MVEVENGLSRRWLEDTRVSNILFSYLEGSNRVTSCGNTNTKFDIHDSHDSSSRVDNVTMIDVEVVVGGDVKVELRDFQEVFIEKKKMYYLGIEGVFDGAFGGVGVEEVVVGEGVVVTYSSLEMLTNSCLGGIMVNMIFLEGFEEEALVEFMVEFG
ncbi:hypothetical protein Tco_1419871 [Tanacetum coccineum]